jgi:hypothetical protein
MRMPTPITLLAMTPHVKVAKLRLVNSGRDTQLLLAMCKGTISIAALTTRKHSANGSLGKVGCQT